MKSAYFNFIAVGILLCTSCLNIANRKTTINVEDNDRHYYPILAGQRKDIAYKITNTGKNPLMITDIITSCGCLNVDKGTAVFTIPPGKDRILTLSYNSAKNVGYVKHYITLYGNFEKALFKELVFDINVVPNAMYTLDYEELYADEVKKDGGVKEFVDGSENNKGYYMDVDLSKSVHQTR